MGSGAVSSGACLRSQGKAGPVQPSGALDIEAPILTSVEQGLVLTYSPQRATRLQGCEGKELGGWVPGAEKPGQEGSSLLSLVDLNMA